MKFYDQTLSSVEFLVSREGEMNPFLSSRKVDNNDQFCLCKCRPFMPMYRISSEFTCLFPLIVFSTDCEQFRDFSILTHIVLSSRTLLFQIRIFKCGRVLNSQNVSIKCHCAIFIRFLAILDSIRPLAPNIGETGSSHPCLCLLIPPFSSSLYSLVYYR